MSIGVGHFADLTVTMYGGEEAMVYELREENMSLAVPPLCCFLWFLLPKPLTTKSVLQLF